MRTSAGSKILLRIVAILLMASFSVVFADSRPPVPKIPFLNPHFRIEYYISDGENFRTFETSGLSIYAFMPVPRQFDSDGLDEIPLFGVVDSDGINAMDLDSVFVQTPVRTLFYDYTEQRAGYFFQDFVRNVNEDATVQLFYSATLGKSVLKNLYVSNYGAVPVEIIEPMGKEELFQGESNVIAFVTNLKVSPKVEPGGTAGQPLHVLLGRGR